MAKYLCKEGHMHRSTEAADHCFYCRKANIKIIEEKIRMEPHWSNRIWDMYVDHYYAKIKDIPADHWTIIASKRHHGNRDGKWRGL